VANNLMAMGFLGYPCSAKAANIDEVKGLIVIKRKEEASVWPNIGSRSQVQTSTHHQVEYQDIRLDIDHQVFAPSCNVGDEGAHKTCLKCFGLRCLYKSRIKNRYIVEASSENLRM
tara:strand:+ start:7865 stop:8212 length:348 start_codon:yes stop_codon:yes gene_type:complete